VNGSDFSPSGNIDGPFSSIGPSVTAGGNTVDLSSPIPLIPASTYLAGELMFVRVTDSGQNRDSTEIETVVITITAANGDVITLRLYETGPDTGEFFAYLPSTPADSNKNDNVISAGGNTQLTASYEGSLGQSDIVVDTAVLNPLNRVFSSVDGESVDDAVVTLINVDTGERAVVYGVDGFSSFPAEVVSGDDATDSAGLLYDNNDGEFRFPIVQPGTYRIEVAPPEGFNFASVLGADELSGLGKAGELVITDASIGPPLFVYMTHFPSGLDMFRGARG